MIFSSNVRNTRGIRWQPKYSTFPFINCHSSFIYYSFFCCSFYPFSWQQQKPPQGGFHPLCCQSLPPCCLHPSHYPSSPSPLLQGGWTNSLSKDWILFVYKYNELGGPLKSFLTKWSNWWHFSTRLLHFYWRFFIHPISISIWLIYIICHHCHLT